VVASFWLTLTLAHVGWLMVGFCTFKALSERYIDA